MRVVQLRLRFHDKLSIRRIFRYVANDIVQNCKAHEYFENSTQKYSPKVPLKLSNMSKSYVSGSSYILRDQIALRCQYRATNIHGV